MQFIYMQGLRHTRAYGAFAWVVEKEIVDILGHNSNLAEEK